MFFSTRNDNPYHAAFNQNKHGFLAWGIALVILGLLAIFYSTFTTLLSIVVLGFVIFVAGAFIIVDTFSFWWGKWTGFFLHLLMGILYLAAGLMLINSPVMGSISITLLLAILYIIVGFFRIVYSMSMRMPRYGWSLFNGIITLLLGILILAQWPMTGLFIIGLFIGIDLVFCGWAYIMSAMAARSLR